MNLQQLRVFAYAARCATLTEAAAQLKLKQPTVSFHLRKLEEELGVELFRKQLRDMVLTDAGRDLLPYAIRVNALADEAGQLMKEYREDGRGRLRIGASYTPATYFMPPFLAAFQNDYPLVIPMLTVKQAGSVLQLLREYEIDVAIVSLSGASREGLHIIPLVNDELKLLLPPGHPLAGKEPLDVADLAGEAFLVHESGSTSREMSEAWADRNGLNWNVRMELGAIETIKESVKHGMGIAILPWRSVLQEVERKELVMRELPGRVDRRMICLAYRQEDVTARVVRTFIQFMRSSCAEE